MNRKFNVAVVLVTFNRLGDLKNTLAKYEAMTMLPDKLIVIDNNSSDGTKQYLKEWENKKNTLKKEIILLNENIGGAGGFKRGVEEAIKDKALDYVMLADDDAEPDENLLKLFNEQLNNQSFDNAVAFRTSIYNPSKRDELSTEYITFKKKLFSIKYIKIMPNDVKLTYKKINILSFVGAIISTEAIRKVGLPDSRFFIYWDDIEYSHRLAEIGNLYLLPSLKYYHKVVVNRTNLWKEYYGTRNSLFTVKKYYSKWTYFWFKNILKFKKYSLVAKIIKKRTKEEIVMYKQAVKDGNKGAIGISKTYGPNIK